MATTYIRLKAVLQQTRRQNSWASLQELAAEIRKRRLVPFRLRGDGSSIDDYMQESSILSLLDFASDLGLLEHNTDGVVKITERGRAALETEDVFARQIRSSVKSYLNNNYLSFETLLDIVGKIKLPDVPDVTTIFKRAEGLEPKPTINQPTFRRVLYLMVCAGGLDRRVRVHYTTT